MQREDAVEDGVDGLAVVESVCYKTEVSGGSSRVEAQVGICGGTLIVCLHLYAVMIVAWS